MEAADVGSMNSEEDQRGYSGFLIEINNGCDCA